MSGQMGALKERADHVAEIEDDWFVIARSATSERPRFQLLRGQFTISDMDDSNLPEIHLMEADISEL
jgi:hypothetical protein